MDCYYIIDMESTTAVRLARAGIVVCRNEEDYSLHSNYLA
jgi:hypothetical protein